MRASPDAGSASMLAVSGALIIGAVAIGAVILLALLNMRLKASTAADLVALSAASGVLEAPGVACGRAREVASENGVTLFECQLNGASARVAVVRAPPKAMKALLGSRIHGIRAEAQAELLPRTFNQPP